MEIDHHHRGRRLFQRGGDVAQVDRGGEANLCVTDAEAAGAEADLVDGLFAGDVEDAAAGAGEAGGGLEQEGGLADAGVAADEDGGSGDEASAQHAIQFRDGGGSAGRRLGFAGQADEGDAPAGRGLGGGAGARGFLDYGVPLTAGFAATGPFGCDGAAGLADEAGYGAGHSAGFTPLGGVPGRGVLWGWVFVSPASQLCVLESRDRGVREGLMKGFIADGNLSRKNL